jgi:ribosomal protein L20A (L18A)
MAKSYADKDFKRLKRLSTIAKMYITENRPTGVSREYIRQLKERYKFKTIEIDGIMFVDMEDLPDEIRKNLKK